MLRYFLIVAVLGAFAHAHKNRCPISLGKYPFIDSKFNGEWYLISGTPVFEKQLCKCGKYTLQSEKTGDDLGLNVKYTGINQEGKPVMVEGISKVYKPERASLAIGVWKKEGSDQWSGVYKQSIVATDYDSYALYLACRPVFDPATKTFGRSLMAQIWSRNETLNKDVYGTLVSVLAGYDVDTDSIKLVERTNCA